MTKRFEAYVQPWRVAHGKCAYTMHLEETTALAASRRRQMSLAPRDLKTPLLKISFGSGIGLFDREAATELMAALGQFLHKTKEKGS